jgi:hypothetical protein
MEEKDKTGAEKELTDVGLPWRKIVRKTRAGELIRHLKFNSP